ncbi:MAG: hypothetical protein VX944_08565 [Myxococcota bacterium]|nr:hypothetical protein [Myxococcota bacterium]
MTAAHGGNHAHSVIPFWALAIAPIGCAASDSPEPPTPSVCEPGDPPAIEVGHGELRFEAFDDGADTPVELVHGPQGGHHSTIAVRANGLDPDHEYIIELIGTIDGIERGGGTPLSSFRCNYGAAAQEYTGGLLIWDAEPEALHRQTATVDASVMDPARTDEHGHPTIVAHATADFLIWDPELENP